MSTDLIINVRDYETRVALIQTGTVADLYVGPAGEHSTVGNIHK